jgi:hypothetical protein
MSISLDRESFALDTPVPVTIVTKNLSDAPLKIPASSKWTTYEYELRQQDREVPLTRFGQRMEDSRGDGSAAEPELPPGDSIVLELPISRLFDLSIVGSYTLRISRPVFRGGSEELVSLVSNRVSFEVVEE